MALAQRIASAGAGRQGSELLDATETGEQRGKILPDRANHNISDLQRPH
jgi:hypothetical protein